MKDSEQFMDENLNSVTIPAAPKKDLQQIKSLNKEIPLKTFRIKHYHDMESREEYEEKLFQKYRKEKGIPDSYLVSEKIRDISDTDCVIGEYLEKKHREKFDTFFSRNPALSRVLNYSKNLSLIKIAKNREKWKKTASISGHNNRIIKLLSNLVEKVSKSILIFKNIERSYRSKYNTFSFKESYAKMLIRLDLQRNLIELSQNAKSINKTLRFWLVNRKDRKRFKKLLRMIRTSYQIFNHASLIDLAAYKADYKKLKTRTEVNNRVESNRFVIVENTRVSSLNQPVLPFKVHFEGFISGLKKYSLILVTFLLAIIVFISSDVLLFTKDIILSFDFIIVLIPALYINIITAKLHLPKKKTILFASVPALTLLGTIVLVTVGLENLVGFLVLASVVVSKLLAANQGRIRQYLNANYYKLAYHKNKYFLLGTILLILGLMFANVFILAPQSLPVPGILIVAFIVLLTVKSKSHVRKLLSLRKKSKISHRSFFTLYEDRNIRSALLIIIFLILGPLIFTVN